MNQKRQSKKIGRIIYKAIAWFLLFCFISAGWTGKALAASGDGLISYGSLTGGDIRLHYQTWSPSSYGGETDGPTAGGNTHYWTVMKGSPTNTGVYVMASVYYTGAAYTTQVWSYSGGAWTSEWSATPSVGQTAYRCVDVAFESVSGQVLVIYLTSTSTTTLYWQLGTRNGSDYSWSADSFTFTTTIGNLRWLRLANKLNDDDLIAAATGDNGTNQVNAKVWDGGAFGNEMGANGTVQGAADNMDSVYETSTGDGMVAWGVSTGIDSSVWSGGSWTSQAVTSTTNAVRNIALAADNAPTSDDIALGAIEDQSSDDVWGKIWDGGAWLRSTELDTNTYSPTNYGRNIDVAYAGETGNCILVFADSTTNTLDWARSTGAGVFAVQTDYDPTPTFNQELVIALVPDASGSNVVMDNFYDLTNLDLHAYYYDDDTASWATPVSGSPIDGDASASSNPEKEPFQFAWESVYKVPTLTEILFLALVGCVVFLGIKRGVIKIKKDDDIKDDIKPENNNNLHNHQDHPSPNPSLKFRVSRRLRVTRRSIDESRKELKENGKQYGKRKTEKDN